MLPSSEENLSLLSNIHPPGWINPEPAGRYNLVVIGGGTAGLVCASAASALGAKVALIERNLLGGDCLNYGCVPSKGIIRSARALSDARDCGRFGVTGTRGAAIDFGAAMARMRRMRAVISSHDSAQRFRDEFGVDLYFGHARFCGRDSVDVGGQRLSFKRAAICSGARAAAPPIQGFEETGFLTNETLFSLTELPPRIAVIGSGPVGSEMAQTFARLGSEVFLIERGPHILPREEPDAAEIVQHAFCRDGVHLHLRTKTVAAGRADKKKTVTCEEEGRRFHIEVDEILVGVGRAPNVEGLGLEAAGITYDPRHGVKVDDRLRTSNPRVFAAGDICFPYKFTHTADALARIVIANALFKGRGRSSALVVPWCTYTDPEVAHIGMYEVEARRGRDVTTLSVNLSDVDRAVIDGEEAGFARVLVKKGSDRILGGTIVARHASEMIGVLSLAMTAGIGLSAISRTIFPYPTQAEVIKKLGDEYTRSRLTPFVKKALSAWLKWQRGD